MLIARLSILTASAILLSCSNVQIKDHEFCGSLGASGAACYHLLTDASRRLTLNEFAVYWNDLKDPKVATSLSTITDWKADIEKLCTDTGQCSVEVQQKVDHLYKKISTIHAKSLEAKP